MATPAVMQWGPTARGTPLHYAAVCGLHDIVKALAIDQSQDVHSQSFDDRLTPLHLASKEGDLGSGVNPPLSWAAALAPHLTRNRASFM